jgi:hypothetical protein
MPHARGAAAPLPFEARDMILKEINRTFDGGYP